MAEWLWDDEAKGLRGQGTEMLRGTVVEGQRGCGTERLSSREAEGQRG